MINLLNKKICVKILGRVKRHMAFTLAEVLITLTVIGVVAAITIPTVVKKFEKTALLNQYKEAYAVLNQMIQSSQQENGPIDTWDYTFSATSAQGRNNFAKKYFTPYLKIGKDCGAMLAPLRNDCFPNTWYKYLNNNNYRNYVLNSNGENHYVATLTNGMIIATYHTEDCVTLSKMCFSFRVDVNGQKGPNVVGKDFFIFNAFPFTNEFSPGGTHSDSATYNVATKSWTRYSDTEIEDSCNPKLTTSQGWSCPTKIIRDGWQIKYY